MNYDSLDLSILKGIITSKKAALEFCNNSDPKIFHPDLWRFARFLLDYSKTYKSCATKRVILEQARKLKSESLLKYVEDVFAKVDVHPFDEREYPFDLEKLKGRYSEKLVEGLKERLTNSSVDIGKSIIEIQSTLNNVKSVNGVKPFKEITLKDYSKEFMSSYKAREQDPNFNTGIKTNYSFLDEATAGLRPSELFLVAGTTGAGKSMFLANLSLQMWMAGNDINTTDNFRPGHSVLLFSLEMERTDYADRLISRLAMVEQTHIRDATLTEEEKGRVNKAFLFLNKFPHFFKIVDNPKLTPEALELAITNEIEMNGKPSIICVDYLNIMKTNNSNKENQDWLMQSDLSEALHEMARSFEVVMLSAVQLNPKGNDKDGGEFGIKSLRRATAISDHCDQLAIIQTRKNERSYPDLSIDLVKNRRGQGISAKLKKHFSCCAILDQKMSDDCNSDIDDISGLVE